MAAAKMAKIGLPGVEGPVWDECGKTRIVQILISHQEGCINSIQFLYINDSDGQYVLSNTFGNPSGFRFHTVLIDEPSEFLICLSGGYVKRRLVSVTFHTNKKSYGPFGGTTVDRLTVDKFEYDFGPMCGNDQKCCFGGFHGTVLNGHVNSIGVYVKTLEPPAPASSTLTTQHYLP